MTRFVPDGRNPREKFSPSKTTQSGRKSVCVKHCSSLKHTCFDMSILGRPHRWMKKVAKHSS